MFFNIKFNLLIAILEFLKTWWIHEIKSFIKKNLKCFNSFKCINNSFNVQFQGISMQANSDSFNFCFISLWAGLCSVSLSKTCLTESLAKLNVKIEWKQKSRYNKIIWNATLLQQRYCAISKYLKIVNPQSVIVWTIQLKILFYRIL